MPPHRLIHDINKSVLSSYYSIEFFIHKLDNSLCTSLIIRLKCILLIDTYKNVTRYEIEHEVHYVNKCVKIVTSLQMALISLKDDKLD